MKKADDSWMRQLEWTEARQQRYADYHERFSNDYEKAKRLFIEEIMWEDVETTELALAMYADLETRFGRGAGNSTVEHKSLDEELVDAGRPDKSDETEPLF